MAAYQLTMLGLVLDIIGAFLVAVEAIKLENLRALREKVFRQAYRYTLSPRIRFVDSEAEPAPEHDDDTRPAERFVGVFMALHYLAGFVALVLVNYLLGGRLLGWAVQGGAWLLNRPWYIAWPILLIAFVYIVVAGFWMVGELVHILMTKATAATIRLLEVIEARTPDGAVGIIGFLFLFAGFGCQLCGAYLGRGTR
jgi:hypothetical protein